MKKPPPGGGGRKENAMKGVQDLVTIANYMEALEGAGQKLKEIILDRAAQDKSLSVWDLKTLVKAAYPEDT